MVWEEYGCNFLYNVFFCFNDGCLVILVYILLVMGVCGVYKCEMDVGWLMGCDWY